MAPKKESADSPAVRNGYLNKHVNALKGYQSRFFVINTEHNRLEYFLTRDAFTSSPQDYRGCIQLVGAEVAPREEDSVSFNVFGSNGDVFQLKADTAKERQKWVDAIRTAVQKLNEAMIDPLAVKKESKEPASKGIVNKKKKKALAEAGNATYIPPTQEMVNAREALAAAETALNEMSEILASYPGPRKAAAQSQDKKGGQPREVTKYEHMLRIKAFSIACQQDLKIIFEAVQAEYLRSRAS